MWAHVVITHVTSYDVLVEGVVLYPMGLLWIFGKKLPITNHDGKQEITINYSANYFH
jgi:hypothetical protein